MLLLLAILMFVGSIIFSMLGQGGGVLYTPLQVWAGVRFHEAAATSLFLIMVVSLSSSLVYRKAQKIDWPLTAVLESATVLGGFLGGLLSARWSGNVLSVLFAGVVIVAGVLMIHPLADRARTPAVQQQGWYFLIWHRCVGDQCYRVSLLVALPLSLLAGLISGTMGVGGGILKVPMMVLLFGIPLDMAIGSSAVMIGVTAAAGFAGHLVNGHWDWRHSLILSGAVFAGGQIGSRISVRADKRRLKRLLGWFLLIVAASMLLRAWWGD